MTTVYAACERQSPRLRDMRGFAWETRDYVAGCTFESWLNSRSLFRATERVLELMGEAANHVSDSAQQEYSQLPLRKMAGLRNILAHEYGLVRLEIIWETATEDVPGLLEQLNVILKDETR